MGRCPADPAGPKRSGAKYASVKRNDIYIYIYIISLSLSLSLYIYIYIYKHIYIYICIHVYSHTRYSFLLPASALQSSSRNCSTAPDVVFLKLVFPYWFFSGGVFFHRPVSWPVHLLNQDSLKGGAVEAGCSGLHYIIDCFTIYNYPHPLHPPVMNTQR